MRSKILNMTGFAYAGVLPDADGRPADIIFIDADRTFAEIAGISQSEIYGMRAAEFEKGSLIHQLSEQLMRQTEDTEDSTLEINGIQYILNSSKTARGYFALEIEELFRSETEEPDEENGTGQIFDKLFQGNPALMAVNLMPGAAFTKVNTAFLKGLGYEEAEVLGHTSEELGIFPDPEGHEKVKLELAEKGRISNKELKVKTKDGKVLDGLFSGDIIESHGSKFFLTVMIDITELKTTQREIEHMSFHDQLTGLYNRRYFEAALGKIDQSGIQPAALMILDVNGLKLINDAFGHLAGDRLLKTVSEVISEVCGSENICARVGGDEFVIIMPGASIKKAERAAEHIRNRVSVNKIENICISVSYGTAARENVSECMEDVFRQAEEQMYRNKLSESASMHHASVSMILKAMYEKNEREEPHSQRVAYICEQIGRRLKLGAGKLSILKTAALLHDIGKIALDKNILEKNEPLSESERSEIKKHSATGYHILKTVNEYAVMAEHALSHHEWWDGSGYPNGKSGREIPFEARIIAIADAIDSMLGYRPYKLPMSEAETLAELKAQSGKQFDPEIIGKLDAEFFNALVF